METCYPEHLEVMKINKNPTHICADSICALVLFQHFGLPGSNSRLGDSPSPPVWTGAGHLVCLKLTILWKSLSDKGKPVTAGNKSLGGVWNDPTGTISFKKNCCQPQHCGVPDGLHWLQAGAICSCKRWRVILEMESSLLHLAKSLTTPVQRWFTHDYKVQNIRALSGSPLL